MLLHAVAVQMVVGPVQPVLVVQLLMTPLLPLLLFVWPPRPEQLGSDMLGLQLQLASLGLVVQGILQCEEGIYRFFMPSLANLVSKACTHSKILY